MAFNLTVFLTFLAVAPAWAAAPPAWFGKKMLITSKEGGPVRIVQVDAQGQCHTLLPDDTVGVDDIMLGKFEVTPAGQLLFRPGVPEGMKQSGYAQEAANLAKAKDSNARALGKAFKQAAEKGIPYEVDAQGRPRPDLKGDLKPLGLYFNGTPLAPISDEEFAEYKKKADAFRKFANRGFRIVKVSSTPITWGQPRDRNELVTGLKKDAVVRCNSATNSAEIEKVGKTQLYVSELERRLIFQAPGGRDVILQEDGKARDTGENGTMCLQAVHEGQRYHVSVESLANASGPGAANGPVPAAAAACDSP